MSSTLIRTGLTLGAAAAVAISGLAPVTAAAAEPCEEQTVEAGVVTAEGCFAGTGSGAFVASGKVRMNGFDVTPHDGSSLTLDPGSGGRSARVFTTGRVDLTATSARWGLIHFNDMSFDINPPKTGDVVLTQSALAQPWPALSGLTPLGVKQPITLTDEGTAEFDLSFAAGGFFLDLVTGTEKEIAAGVGFTVEDGKYKLTNGEFSLGEFELAHLIKINEAELSIGEKKFDVTADGGLTAISGPFGVRFGTTIENSKMTRAELGLSGLNVQLGTSGIYLQKFLVGVFPNPPYGGKGSIGLSAGPKFAFLGKEVEAVEADGTVEVRGADTEHRKPPYFTVGGKFSLMSLPVGNASFGYWFGQGTKFSASIGLGLPSGTNDPGQPTYLGGGMSGWTSAKHFDLEGNVKLKLLGVELLGADTVLSDLGMGGCLKAAFWYVGGGVNWSPFRASVFAGDTCDIGRYRPQAGMARGMRDGSSLVRLGQREHFIRVSSTGTQAPRVALSQPGGPRLVAPPRDDADGIARFPGGTAMSAKNGSTLFVVKKPGGQWEMSSLPGSPPVTDVAVARPLPKPKVKAWVTGSGRTRQLHWQARDIRHQRLQFAERIGGGEREILRTSRAQGVRTFRPAKGSYGLKRRLVVDVRQRHNSPRSEFVADRYRVPFVAAPSAVRRLTVERRLADVVATWRPVRGAARYEVTARPVGSGAYYRAVVSRPRARLTVGTTGRMKVTVTPLTWQDRAGTPKRRTLDTRNIVSSPRQAAKKLVRSLHPSGRRTVVGTATCPRHGSCTGWVRTTVGGATVGRQRFTVPADMADRVRVTLDRRLPRQGARAVVQVSQPTRKARAHGQL